MKRIELGISFFQKSTEQNHGCTWHANCRTMAQDGLHAGLYPLASSAPHRFVRRGKSFFFSNVSASPLQCISGMWNAPVLRRGFICLSDCCGTILNNGSLRLMRFRIHGSVRTHCQSEREFKRCFMYTDKISLFPIKSPYPPARVVQNDTQPQASTSSRTRKPRV